MILKKANQPRPKCIYCGDYDLSKEHILSNWINTEFPEISKNNLMGNFKVDPLEPKYLEFVVSKKRQGGIGTLKIRCACKKCNNTWMSQIVNDSKPIIIDLIRKKNIILTFENQIKIALWVTLTAINHEYKRTKDFGELKNFPIKEQDRSLLQTDKKLSDNWQVFITKSDSVFFKRAIAGVNNFIQYPDRPKCHSVDCYIAIEGVIFISRYITENYPHPPRFEDMNNKFMRIWPHDETLHFDKKFYLSQAESDILQSRFTFSYDSTISNFYHEHFRMITLMERLGLFVK